MEQRAKIYIAGHAGLVGFAIVRELKRQGYKNLCVASHAHLDLWSQAQTETFFEREKPDYVFMATMVGGLVINDKHIVGYEGKIANDLSKPDGTPRKLVDSSKIFGMGWKPETSFEEGIRITYRDFLENIDKYLNRGRLD